MPCSQVRLGSHAGPAACGARDPAPRRLWRVQAGEGGAEAGRRWNLRPGEGPAQVWGKGQGLCAQGNEVTEVRMSDIHSP